MSSSSISDARSARNITPETPATLSLLCDSDRSVVSRHMPSLCTSFSMGPPTHKSSSFQSVGSLSTNQFCLNHYYTRGLTCCQ